MTEIGALVIYSIDFLTTASRPIRIVGVEPTAGFENRQEQLCCGGANDATAEDRLLEHFDRIDHRDDDRSAGPRGLSTVRLQRLRVRRSNRCDC
jgi:hypothetical protein